MMFHLFTFNQAEVLLGKILSRISLETDLKASSFPLSSLAIFPRPPELKEHLDNAPRHWEIVGLSCAGPGAELHDESLAAQHSL